MLPSRSNLNILISHVLSHLISLGKTVLRDVISISIISSNIKSIPSISSNVKSILRDVKRISRIFCYVISFISYVARILSIIRYFVSILRYVKNTYFSFKNHIPWCLYDFMHIIYNTFYMVKDCCKVRRLHNNVPCRKNCKLYLYKDHINIMECDF